MSLSIMGSIVRVEVDGTSRDVDIGCEGRNYARVGRKLYVACGADGVVRVDVGNPRAPTVDGRTRVDGEAEGIFVVEGRPWLKIARMEARPADGYDWTGTQNAGPREVGGTAEFDPSSSPSSSPTVKSEGRSLIAPPRAGGLWEFTAGTRAFLTVGDFGIGTLGEARLTRRFEEPVAIHVEASPAGVASASRGAVGTFGLSAVVALDTTFFEVGLGAGVATVYDRGPRSSFAVAQVARIGARDGLAAFIKTNVVVTRSQYESEAEFDIGSFELLFQIPVRPDWRLFIRGGGGPIGFGYGDIGVRYRVDGTEGPGTLALIGAAGGAGVFGVTNCQTYDSSNYLSCNHVQYAGPSVYFGVEARF